MRSHSFLRSAVTVTHTHTHTSLPHRSSPTSCWRRDFYVARRTHGNEGKMKRRKGPGPVRAHVASFETRNVSRRSDRKHDIPEYLIPCCWISSLLRFCYDHNNNHLNYIFFNKQAMSFCVITRHSEIV